MTELFNVVTVKRTLGQLDDLLVVRPELEKVPFSEALNRVVAADIKSPADLPAFRRSTMDGFAVRARDTFGCSEAVPSYLKVAGEILMGSHPRKEVSTGEAVKIHTGGMIPEGADAVVMVENTQPVDEFNIEVTRPVAMGENVLQVGEDIAGDGLVLPAGHKIRPQDVGGLAALGITEITVYRKPRIAIISSGDEVVSPDTVPGPGQIRDINTYVLSNLTLKADACPVCLGVIPDDFDKLKQAISSGLAQTDAVVISAGSSVSARDMTARAINSLGKPGVIVHGISIKPGKPTIVALVNNKPVFGLPGNPVSAMVLFNVLVKPVIYKLSGMAGNPLPCVVQAALTHNIASAPGREDYVPVRMIERETGPAAEPVFGKSNLIYTLVKADGMIRVPLDVTGIMAGEKVEVILF